MLLRGLGVVAVVQDQVGDVVLVLAEQTDHALGPPAPVEGVVLPRQLPKPRHGCVAKHIGTVDGPVSNIRLAILYQINSQTSAMQFI